MVEMMFSVAALLPTWKAVRWVLAKRASATATSLRTSGLPSPAARTSHSTTSLSATTAAVTWHLTDSVVR